MLQYDRIDMTEGTGIKKIKEPYMLMFKSIFKSNMCKNKNSFRLILVVYQKF